MYPLGSIRKSRSKSRKYQQNTSRFSVYFFMYIGSTIYRIFLISVASTLTLSVHVLKVGSFSTTLVVEGTVISLWFYNCCCNNCRIKTDHLFQSHLSKSSVTQICWNRMKPLGAGGVIPRITFTSVLHPSNSTTSYSFWNSSKSDNKENVSSGFDSYAVARMNLYHRKVLPTQQVNVTSKQTVHFFHCHGEIVRMKFLQNLKTLSHTQSVVPQNSQAVLQSSNLEPLRIRSNASDNDDIDNSSMGAVASDRPSIWTFSSVPSFLYFHFHKPSGREILRRIFPAVPAHCFLNDNSPHYNLEPPDEMRKVPEFDVPFRVETAEQTPSLVRTESAKRIDSNRALVTASHVGHPNISENSEPTKMKAEGELGPGESNSVSSLPSSPKTAAIDEVFPFSCPTAASVRLYHHQKKAWWRVLFA